MLVMENKKHELCVPNLTWSEINYIRCEMNTKTGEINDFWE